MNAPAVVLTLGETCVLLDPLDDGDAELGLRFQLRVSGSESNVSIALTRLGVQARYVSSVAADSLGDLVWRTLVHEDIDLRFASRDPSAFTGLAFKFRNQGAVSLTYYRRGSAASRMTPEQLVDGALEGVQHVHLTGITSALGDGPRALVRSAAERANARGIPITFDLNFRPALWPDARAAAAAANELLPYVSWVLCGFDEARRVFGGNGPEDTIAAIMAGGARGVILRVGADGAWVASSEQLVLVPAVHVNEVVDENGAGDAFDAGFVYGLLLGLRPKRAAAIGNLLGALALGGSGDWEMLPHVSAIRAELELITKADREKEVAGGEYGAQR